MSEIENIERIATELMEAGKYDAAAMYWQKAIDTGLLDIGEEDGALDLMERCQYCHEKGCEPYETYGHALSSQYYFADEVSFNAIEKYKGDDFKNALDKISKTPECSELNYADQLAVRDTIEELSGRLNDLSSDEKYYIERLEYTLGDLAQKGYPKAQGVLAEHFEQKGDYLRAKRYYDMLSDNENVLPLRQDYYSEKSSQMSDLKAGREPRPITLLGERYERFKEIHNHKDQDSVSEPLATERIATELMDAGKYDAAAMYWQKAIDTGLSNPGQEDGQLDLLEQCQYCHENGCKVSEVGEHVHNSQYYNPDIYGILDGEKLSKSLDDLKKIPEATDLNYADRKAVKETIAGLTKNIDSYDEKNMQKAEQVLAGLSAKGYPDAQKFMAERLEKRGEYASAQTHYNRLADNEHIAPIRQEHYSEKVGQMRDLRSHKEPRPLTALDKRLQKIDGMKPKQETPKKSLADRLAEYGNRLDIAAGNLIDDLALNILKTSAEIAKAGIQFTGAVLDSGVKLAGAFVNAPDLSIGKGLESSLVKGMDQVIDWSSKMLSQKGGR